MSRPVADYEQLGAFYLGRPYDRSSRRTLPEPLLYDSKDLTTHAVIVGMTGSGKTGLGISLLEEAALDGVPAIVIDPKGDLTNLALTFPELSAREFLPWIDEGEAALDGHTVAEHARHVAKRWRDGLADWGQDGARIARLEAAAEVAVYTPGSLGGRPLAVLESFAAPTTSVLDDPDAFRERVQSAVSGLLALLGLDADPLRSREHVLLSSLLDRAWREGRSLDLADLVRAVLDPGMTRVGVLDLESFFPADDRRGLAMRLNNLLASPAFAAWSQGEPLDITQLLVARDGRPRISVLSIAHLSDPERMFFVTLLLQELVGWMRAQGGTRSLRAMLYMDEVMGYLPPTQNPPSKLPLLTLLKQARASGLGVVLATQNPVDLDYKALSNAGTWFLGRLQTERDQARVLDGLQGASMASGAGFDRGELQRTLSGLGSRVFLMHDVHEDAPVVFQTRWCLSYLRGPLTRHQIRELTGGGQPEAGAASGADAARSALRAVELAPTAAPAAQVGERPILGPGIEDRFLPCTESVHSPDRLEWRPAVMGRATLHYARARPPVDHWRELTCVALLEGGGDPWVRAVALAQAPELLSDPVEEGGFAALGSDAARAASYGRWGKRLATMLYRERPLELMRAKKLKLVSDADEDEASFRARVRQVLHERRDLEVEKLRKRHAPKLARLVERIRKAEQRVEKQEEQYQNQKMQTALSVGATVLGALFGRKLTSVGTVGRATTAARRASRVSREKADVERAELSVAALRADLEGLERSFAADLEGVRAGLVEEALELDRFSIRVRKSDLDIREMRLLWTPWIVTPDGGSTAGNEWLERAGACDGAAKRDR